MLSGTSANPVSVEIHKHVQKYIGAQWAHSQVKTSHRNRINCQKKKATRYFFSPKSFSSSSLASLLTTQWWFIWLSPWCSFETLRRDASEKSLLLSWRGALCAVKNANVMCAQWITGSIREPRLAGTTADYTGTSREGPRAGRLALWPTLLWCARHFPLRTEALDSAVSWERDTHSERER